MRHARGFTLLELLLVLVLIGIGTSLAVTSISSLTSRSTDQLWSDRTLSVLKKTRNRAILQGKPVHVRIDARHGEIWSSEIRLLSLPSDYHFKMSESRLPSVADESPDLQLTFFPDGSLTAGEFFLMTPTGTADIFRFQAITGRVDRTKMGQDV